MLKPPTKHNEYICTHPFMLNSETDTEFAASERLIKFLSIRLEYVHLSYTCMSVEKEDHYNLSADITIHHGNRKKEKTLHLNPVEQKILI